MEFKVIKVDSKYYHTVLDMLSKEKRAFVNDVVVADKYYLVFDNGPIAGFTTREDGELSGLFSLKKGLGEELFKLRLEKQCSDFPDIYYLKLNCYGDYLADLYSGYGFTEYKRDKFNREYASKDWNYSKYGTPDIVYMAYDCSL